MTSPYICSSTELSLAQLVRTLHRNYRTQGPIVAFIAAVPGQGPVVQKVDGAIHPSSLHTTGPWSIEIFIIRSITDL